MKKLAELVSIEENTIEKIVLTIQPNSRMELLKLGFTGNEIMIYLSKGKDHTCRIAYNSGRTTSWNWGESGHTLISNSLKEMQRQIVDCVVDDMDIAIEGSKAVLAKDCYKTGCEKDDHTLKVMYWRDCSDGEVVVHKDGVFYKRFPNETSVISHFVKLGYNVHNVCRGYSKQTGCNVDEYICTAL